MPAAGPPDRLLPDADGWLRWQGGTDVEVLVRVAHEPDGRVRIAELNVRGAVSSSVLREVPVGRIEACANVLLGGWSTSGSAPARSLPTRPPAGSTGGWEIAGRREERAMERPPERSTRRGRPDAFYREVAASYLELAQQGRGPARLLAERHDVPVSTVHRWVKEARRRGLLPPGRAGKAG
jgi:hypothetical protein